MTKYDTLDSDRVKYYYKIIISTWKYCTLEDEGETKINDNK